MFQALTLVKEREELITATSHFRENEKEIRSNEFVKLLKSDDYEVEPLFEEAQQLEYQGYGKLIMFLHKADGKCVIHLGNKKILMILLHCTQKFR